MPWPAAHKAWCSNGTRLQDSTAAAVGALEQGAAAAVLVRGATRSLSSPWASRRTRFGRRKVQPSWRQEPGTCTQTCSYEGEIHTRVHMRGNLSFARGNAKQAGTQHAVFPHYFG